MYGQFTYIWAMFVVNAAKYSSTMELPPGPAPTPGVKFHGTPKRIPQAESRLLISQRGRKVCYMWEYVGDWRDHFTNDKQLYAIDCHR